MLQLHLDPLGGVAGDMFVAALLDLRPDLAPGLQAALSHCPLIADVDCTVLAHDDGILTGRRFVVSKPAATDIVSRPHRHEPSDLHRHPHAAAPGHPHGDPYQDSGHGSPSHGHIHWRDIRAALAQLPLDEVTRAHAIGIFSLLAGAEARIHGQAVDDVAFHEVGAWDSIADIVAASWLIGRLDAQRWTIGAIPIGSGRVRTAHGPLPVPAPAAARLLEGFEVMDDGIAGERVTPTGAAIVAYLCGNRDTPVAARVLRASGYGFGARRLPGISNCLRVLAFEAPATHAPATDSVAVLECEIDDQSGEDLATALAHLRAAPGVIDALQAPVYGKKGRLMTHLRILAEPAHCAAVEEAIFRETTTLGIRHAIVARTILRREMREIEREGHAFRAKIADRPAGRTVKIEADDLAGISGAADRSRLRAGLEAKLLAEGDGP